jgi:hypothetical protein
LQFGSKTRDLQGVNTVTIGAEEYITAVINETCTFYEVKAAQGSLDIQRARPSQQLASVAPAKPAPTDG